VTWAARFERRTSRSRSRHDRPQHNFGEYSDPLRVVAFNTVQGWAWDVSKEIAYDVLDRAYDPDTTVSAGAKRFITCDPGVSAPLRRRYCASLVWLAPYSPMTYL
jgi:hypothetical protein